jgi:hypothetical protein
MVAAATGVGTVLCVFILAGMAFYVLSCVLDAECRKYFVTLIGQQISGLGGGEFSFASPAASRNGTPLRPMAVPALPTALRPAARR